ncbi:hypothetical protein FACS18942_09440 [Planctomycetales bacterium]|nr:hypothetical protein FACS18942_09440 [Planctomycetales bacterium]GHT38028.1 hypothetical protein FACS189427_11800 [Planctomycetales bacterium]
MQPKPDYTIFVRSDAEKATSRLLERERTAGEASEVPESFVRQYVSELTAQYDDYVAKGLIISDIIVSSDEETADDVTRRILQTIPY